MEFYLVVVEIIHFDQTLRLGLPVSGVIPTPQTRLLLYSYPFNSILSIPLAFTTYTRR